MAINTVFAASISGVDQITSTPNSANAKADVDFSPGETVTITFDFDWRIKNTSTMQEAGADFGDYEFVTPSFGTMDVTSPVATTIGIVEWTITEAEWVAAGSPAMAGGSVGLSDALIENLQQDFGITDVADASFQITFTCFAQGTQIMTPHGPVEVQDLGVGDLVTTADGRSVPVRWVGRQTLSTVFGSAERRRPIRISAGALGDGLPLRDLVLTADHALLLDGVLINAGALVNGGTIVPLPWNDLGAEFTVYHVETEAHEVILANGAPSETFIDYRHRRAFDNYQEYLDLYGCERIIPEMPLPRISSARQVPQDIKRRLGGPESPADPAKACHA